MATSAVSGLAAEQTRQATPPRIVSITAHDKKESAKLDSVVNSGAEGFYLVPIPKNSARESVAVEAAMKGLQGVGIPVAMVMGADSIPGVPVVLKNILKNVVVSRDKYGIRGPHVEFDLVNQNLQDVKTAVDEGPRGKLIYLDFDGKKPAKAQTRHFHFAFPEETANKDLSGQSKFMAALNESNQELKEKGFIAKWGTEAAVAAGLALGLLKSRSAVYNGCLRVALNDKEDNAASGRGLDSCGDGVGGRRALAAYVPHPFLRAAVALESQKN